jgi:hypothetical protein
MQIVKDQIFISSLQNILENIAQDSISQAMIFNNELEEKINNLAYMPFKFRQSLFHKNENIRDLIYKGYVVPYLVDTEIIVILNIFKNKNY